MLFEHRLKKIIKKFLEDQTSKKTEDKGGRKNNPKVKEKNEPINQGTEHEIVWKAN